ncbi:MAG: O-antigen ligase family protein, partial [Bacteroidota bacterium]
FSGINSGNRVYRGISWFILALGSISIFFTYSRTAWLLSLAALFLWFGKELFTGKRLYLWLGGILFLLNLPWFKARIFRPENFVESTLGFRTQIWQNTLKIITEYWQWGSGPGSFSKVYNSYPTGNGLVQHGHQLYLQLWLENGLLSLAVFIKVMVNNLVGFNGFQSTFKAVALVIVIFLAAGFFETWWAHQFCGGYFWLLIGLLQSLRTGQIDS